MRSFWQGKNRRQSPSASATSPRSHQSCEPPYCADPGPGITALADATHLRLTDSQRLDWLRLFRSENVGPRGIMAQAPPGPDDDPAGGGQTMRAS
jgi:hypothetical protein